MIRNNPVFIKDMKVMFRSPKVYWAITIYLLILTVVAGFVLTSMTNFNYYGGNGFDPTDIIQLYFVLLGIQMFIVTLVVPSFTSSSISGERERQTLDFMLITPMSTKTIIVGKLMSSILLTCLMIISAVPIYSIIFYYGGVGLFEFIMNTLFLLVYACFVGSISMVYSTIFKKSNTSIAVTNLCVIGLCGGTFAIMGICALIIQLYNLSDIWEHILCFFCVLIMSVNPVVSFISIMDTQMGTSNVWDVMNQMLDVNFNPHFLQAWHIVLVLYIVLTVFFINLASKNIIPKRRVKYNLKKHIKKD